MVWRELTLMDGKTVVRLEGEVGDDGLLRYSGVWGNGLFRYSVDPFWNHER